MEFTLNFMSIGLTAAFLCVITVSVYLVVTLRNANVLIVKINAIADKNADNINLALALLPEAAKNLNDATLATMVHINRFGVIVGTVDGALTDTMTALTAGSDYIRNIAAVAGTLIKAVAGIFPRGKKGKQ